SLKDDFPQMQIWIGEQTVPHTKWLLIWLCAFGFLYQVKNRPAPNVKGQPRRQRPHRWPRDIGALRTDSEFLAEHNPVSFRSAHTELAHPPRLIRKCLCECGAVAHQFAIELVNAFNGDVCEVRMVARLVGGLSVSTLPEHQAER